LKENNRILEATDSASIKPNPRNDEESKIEMYSKLIITIEPSEHIEYDVDKLHNALLYFCYHNLKHIDPKYLPDLYIDVDTDYCREMDNCGSLNADESDILLIALSTKNIEKESGMGFYYDSPLKSLFHVFLHEAYNMFTLIECYIQGDMTSDIGISAGIQNKENEEKLNKLMEQIVLDSTNANSSLETEQEAEFFAFKNISLFENIYDHNFLYTPRKAFLVKADEGADDIELKEN
jgi:hypothetical protein